MMTEILFALFFLLFLLCFLPTISFWFCKKDFVYDIYIRLILAGICLGIASMLRPMGHYLIALSVLLLLCSNRPWLSKLKQGTILFISWLAIVFWWLLRNYLLTGYIFFHTLPGYHFTYYFATPIHMQVHSNAFSKSLRLLNYTNRDRIRLEEEKKGRPLYEIEACRIKESNALQYAFDYPILGLKHGIYNMFKSVAALYSSEILKMCGTLPLIILHITQSPNEAQIQFLQPLPLQALVEKALTKVKKLIKECKMK